MRFREETHVPAGDPPTDHDFVSTVYHTPISTPTNFQNHPLQANKTTHPQASLPIPPQPRNQILNPHIITYHILVSRKQQYGDLGEDAREEGDGGVGVLGGEVAVDLAAAFGPFGEGGGGVEGGDYVFSLLGGCE